MRWPQKGTKCRWEEGRGTLGGGQTFHGHAGRGVDAALGVAHAAEIVTCVLLTHALDAQPLVRVSQVDSCKQPVEVRVQMGLGPWPHEPPHLAFRPRPALPDSFSSSLLSLYHTMLGTCAPATGHRISRESLTFTRRSVKFCVLLLLIFCNMRKVRGPLFSTSCGIFPPWTAPKIRNKVPILAYLEALSPGKSP